MKLKMVPRHIIYSFCFSFLLFFGAEAIRPSKILTIASGTNRGNYFKVGQNLCYFVNINNDIKDSVIKCVAMTTNGTIDNINLVLKDETTIGIGQASTISRRSATQPLRFVAKLYIEPVFVLASKTSDAKSLKDVISQDKINIGAHLSGENITAKRIMVAKKWKKQNFKEYGRYEIMSLLCSNRLDIAFLVNANPSNFVSDIINKCGARILPLNENFIQSFIGKNKGFRAFTITPKTYLGQNMSVRTIATHTIIFAQKDTSSEAIKAFLQSIFKDMKSFTNSNPSFKNKDIKYFLNNDTDLITHPGTLSFINDINKTK